MKAFLVDNYSKHSRLRAAQLPEPEIGDHDVLVRIVASGVNPLDAKIMAGSSSSCCPTSHRSCSATTWRVVERVGPGVQQFAPGEQVYARPDKDRIGTFAELIAIDEADLAVMPAALTMAEAASLPLVALTAWQAPRGCDPAQRAVSM
jgi:NADPH:quinone reductase-like Zn-dependent oxidoreductase